MNILEENTHLVKKSNETFVFYLKNLKTSSGGCSISKLEIYCFWNWKEKPDYKVHDSTVKAQYNIRRKIVENKHKNNIKNTLAIVQIYKAELYHKKNVTWQKNINIRPVKIHISLFFAVVYKGNIIIHEWIKIFKKPKSAIQSGN